MLRTRTFRTKLLGILSVPVAALIGVTAFAGASRLSDARDAGEFQHRAAVVAAATALADRVQLEEAASADIAKPAPDEALAARRADTDQAAQTFRDALAAAGDARSTAFDLATERIRRNLTA